MSNPASEPSALKRSSLDAEIEADVSQEMVEAGAEAIASFRYDPGEEVIAYSVYLAMERIRRST